MVLNKEALTKFVSMTTKTIELKAKPALAKQEKELIKERMEATHVINLSVKFQVKNVTRQKKHKEQWIQHYGEIKTREVASEARAKKLFGIGRKA